MGAAVIDTARAVVSALGYAASAPFKAYSSVENDNTAGTSQRSAEAVNTEPCSKLARVSSDSSFCSLHSRVLRSTTHRRQNAAKSCASTDSPKASSSSCAGQKRAAAATAVSSVGAADHTALSKASSQSLLRRSLTSSGLLPLADNIVQNLLGRFCRSECFSISVLLFEMSARSFSIRFTFVFLLSMKNGRRPQRPPPCFNDAIPHVHFSAILVH